MDIVYKGKRYRERRKSFLVNKPLQLRFMTYVTLTVLIICGICLTSLYVGIWGSILNSFSDTQFRNDLLTAARMAQYDDSRYPYVADPLSGLAFFKQSENLSLRQREVFREILATTNRSLLPKLAFVILIIAWGSIYLSHKIAGPLYRFQLTFQEMQKGDLTIRVRLRKNDEAQGVAEDFNRTLVYLDVHISRLKNIIRENEDNPERLVGHLKEELAKIKSSVDK